MAKQINSAAGDPAANAYTTVEAANIFLEEMRLYASAWENSPNKEAALMWATREVDSYNFIGAISSTTQALKWPRTGARLADGREFATDEIPLLVAQATAELALHLSVKDQSSTPTGEKYEKIKVGPIELTLRDQPGGGSILDTMPDDIRAILKPLLAPARGLRVIRA